MCYVFSRPTTIIVIVTIRSWTTYCCSLVKQPTLHLARSNNGTTDLVEGVTIIILSITKSPQTRSHVVRRKKTI